MANKIGEWVKGHKAVAYGGAGVGLFGLYAVYSHLHGSSSSGSGSPAVNPGQQLVNPGAEQVTLTSPISSAPDGSWPRHRKTDEVGPTVAPVASTPAPKTFGQGIVNTINGPMVWLGVTGAGGSTAHDFQVGGGAPVFFGNAQANAIGGTTQAGVDVYTPVDYEDLVSSAPG